MASRAPRKVLRDRRCQKVVIKKNQQERQKKICYLLSTGQPWQTHDCWLRQSLPSLQLLFQSFRPEQASEMLSVWKDVHYPTMLIEMTPHSK